MLKLWRRLTGQSGPECDRCGKPTWNPSLYYAPSQCWRCEPCEEFVAYMEANDPMTTEK